MSKASKQQDKLINLQAQQLAAQVANWAATLDFQKERFSLLELPQFQQGMQLEVDKFAWTKAQDTWQRAYQESLLTGTYQGQPTTQWLIDQAKLTGSYNGERTLEGQLTDAQIQDMHDKMKLANDEFLANTTGYFNGQKTFDREKFEAANALDGWKFIATLTGPQNAFKQARAIATMPGGMSQLMQAFAGQYMLPSGAAVGSGGAGGNNPAGQLNDLMMGAGGNAPPGVPQGAPQGAPGGAGGSNAVVMSGPPGSAAGPTLPATGPTLPATGPVAGSPYTAYMPQGAPQSAPPGMTAWASGQVPGAGTNPSTWDAATRDAANGWNTTHPGYTADGSPAGYSYTGQPQITPVYANGWAGEPQGYEAANAALGGGYTYSPPGAQAPVGAYNYSATADGSTAVYPPGVASPAATPDVSTQTPQNPATMQPYVYGGGVNAPLTTGTSMTSPNQINLENWNNAYQYQKDLTLAAYADQGWDPSLAAEAIAKSAPKYGGVSKGSIAF